MLTPAQSRAARALLDWSQTELAERSNLSESTIRNFEKGKATPSTNNLGAVKAALEQAGVEFIPENGGGAGVRLQVTADIEHRLGMLVALYRSDQLIGRVLDQVDAVKKDCRDLRHLSDLFGDRIWERPRIPPDERGIAIQERITSPPT